MCYSYFDCAAAMSIGGREMFPCIGSKHRYSINCLFFSPYNTQRHRAVALSIGVQEVFPFLGDENTGTFTLVLFVGVGVSVGGVGWGGGGGINGRMRHAKKLQNKVL